MRISGNCLYLEKSRVYSDVDIVSFCYVNNSGENSLWCLTIKGDLYAVNEEKLNNQNNQREGGNTNIFSDLLEEDNLGLCMTSEPVYVLRSEDIVLHVQDIPVTVCVNTAHIAVITAQKERSNFKVLLYENVVISEHGETGTLKESRPMKFMFLPFNFFKIGNGNCLYPDVCMKFLSSDLNCVKMEENKSTGGVVIDHELFKRLFGEDVALLESDVIILSSEDGKLYYVSIAFLSVFTSEHGENERHSALNYWKEFCCLPSAIVDVFSLVLGKKSDSKAGDINAIDSSTTQTCLAVCCKDGSLTVFHSAVDCSQPISSKVSLIGPVTAAYAFSDSIFYCTQQKLYQARVILETSGGTSNAGCTVRISSRLIDQCRVKDLKVRSDDAYIHAQDSPITLSCMLESGELKILTVPPATGSHCPDSSDGPLMDTVASGKSLMLALERLSVQIAEAKHQRGSQEAWIRQLSIATWLLHMYHQRVNDLKVSSEGIVKCCLVPVRDMHTGDAMVQCEVTHSLPHSLSADWSVSVSLLPMSGIRSADSVESPSTVVNSRTIKLDTDWPQGKVLSIVLGTDVNVLLTGCALVVKFVLDCEVLLVSQPSVTQRKSLLSVPVYEENMDLLQLLVPVRLEAYCAQEKPNKSDDVKMALSSLATNRRGCRQGNKKTIHNETMCVKRRFHWAGLEVDGCMDNATSLLQYLVPQLTNGEPSSLTQHHFTLYGRPVQLCLELTSNVDERTAEITIRGEDCTVAGIHLAVIRKLKKHDLKLNRTPIQLKHVRQALQCLEDIASELQCSGTKPGSLTLEVIRQAYIQLRQLPLL